MQYLPSDYDNEIRRKRTFRRVRILSVNPLKRLKSYESNKDHVISQEQDGICVSDNTWSLTLVS